MNFRGFITKYPKAETMIVDWVARESIGGVRNYSLEGLDWLKLAAELTVLGYTEINIVQTRPDDMLMLVTGELLDLYINIYDAKNETRLS